MMKEITAPKLFIGQIPRDITEEQLRAVLEPYGEIHSMNLLYEKTFPTPALHRGCAFVTFYDYESSRRAQDELHEKKVLPGMRKKMVIKPSTSETDENECKLYVAMLSRKTTENEVREMFSPFGTIEKITILKDGDASKGCGFVKFETRTEAQNAIKALHASKTMEGCRQPLIVKLADTEKDKIKKLQEAALGIGPSGVMDAQQAALADGIALLASQVAYYEQVFAQMGLPQVIQAAPGVPLAQTLALSGQGVAAAQAGLIPPNQNQTNIRRDGPDGANLVIYQIPPEFNDGDLKETFSPFGNVLSANVIMERTSGDSKGYGFVSYDSVFSANQAMSAMNGLAIGGRRLRVQLKKPRDKPY